MKCNDCFQQISNYLEGEIDAALRRELEEHLGKCHRCQVVYDSTRKTIELYCDGKLFELPVGVRARLHAALRRHWEGQIR
ncbi:MAG: zf-HC2 domain-containing protein [Acidobacteriia bacterium]|nr:zf-HC2 domain-containing protein [Terriglobia bacterium]